MAGADSRFNAATFRSAIHFAMSMGKPTNTADQLVFKWTPRENFNPGDRQHAPFNWTDNPVTSEQWGPVTVPAAYELKLGPIDNTPVGTFEQPTLVVTILDDDYPLIFDDDGVRADVIELPNHSIFKVTFIAPPVGLFEVTIYTLYAVSLDQS